MDRRLAPLSLLLSGLLPSALGATPCAPVDINSAALALSCEGCHGRGGHSVEPIPSLAGRPLAELEEALIGFVEQPEPEAMMPRLLKNLSPELLQQLACYFSQQAS